MEEKNLHVEEGALKVTKLTLYEAVAIIVGANVGSGILGLAYSSRLAGWPILVELSSAVYTFVISTFVGLFFGFYPAYRASKLNPIDCLRYE